MTRVSSTAWARNPAWGPVVPASIALPLGLPCPHIVCVLLLLLVEQALRVLQAAFEVEDAVRLACQIQCLPVCLLAKLDGDFMDPPIIAALGR